MTGAKCANCGAEISFRSPGSLIVICEYCNSANLRKDQELEYIGHVGEVTPLASHFQYGTTGRFEGRSFIVLGQIQLDHGLGPWNEWIAEIDGGEWIWIAEAQGEIIVFRDLGHLEGAPPHEQLHAGSSIPVRDLGQWMVSERGFGKVLAARGELPFRIGIGSQTRYVDLTQGEDGFATLDWTRKGDPELLVGRKIRLEELHLDPHSLPDHRPESVRTRAMNCSHCDAALEIKDPEHAVRIACSHCGAVLDGSSPDAQVLDVQAKIRQRPTLPLGIRGTLQGEEVQLIGYLERSVRVEGTRYPWREYLLRTSAGAYRWLMEQNGHWTRIEPLNPAVVGTPGRDSVYFRGERYKHFTSGAPRVDCVLGEFYWKISVGDESQAHDFVAPPRMVSIEQVGSDEISASLGHHLSQAELREAFDYKGPLPAPRKVGPVTPNPVPNLKAWWKVAGLVVVAFLALRILIGIFMANEVVHAGSYGPTPITPTGNNVQFTPPFEIKNSGSVVIELRCPSIRQGWMGVGGALVCLDDGKVSTFGLENEFWSGVSGGESWKEGSRRASTRLAGITAGRYRVRLDPIAQRGGLNRNYDIEIRSQVPRTWPMFVGIVFALIIPVVVSVRRQAFEGTRWQDSDHPWGES